MMNVIANDIEENARNQLVSDEISENEISSTISTILNDSNSKTNSAGITIDLRAPENTCKGHCVKKETTTVCGKGVYCNNWESASSNAKKNNYQDYLEALADIY